jgi:hypothetical protein
MAHAILQSIRATAAVAALMLLAFPACAQSLFHRAENQVQVALVKVVRTADYTEVHLQTQAALKSVCWYATGENSPYLLADGRRFRYRSGNNIAACPAQQDYANQAVMVLRFEPLAPQTRTFSLVEGQGGENQMIDPSSTKSRFWNFLRVKLD